MWNVEGGEGVDKYQALAMVQAVIDMLLVIGYAVLGIIVFRNEK